MMDSTFSISLAAGIISALIATTLVIFFREFWIKILRPKFEELLYKDVLIKGVWDVEKIYSAYDNKQEVKKIVSRTLLIEQSGHSIKGSITSTDDIDKHEVWDISGQFNNLILTASYVARDKSVLDRGSLTLMLDSNGKKLEGVCAYYSNEYNDVRPSKYICRKKDGIVK